MRALRIEAQPETSAGRLAASPPPKVSIGMPVYNAERYLPDALDCILNQTFEDFEVVITDNASTDATEEICRSYAENDPRVRYSRNGRNVGIVANFNLAFYLSRGQYFKWSAHDDLLSPDYLAKCVRVLDEDPTVVLVSPRVQLVGSDGLPLTFDDTKGRFVTTYGEKIEPIRPTVHHRSSLPSKRFREVVVNFRVSLLNAYVYGLMRAEALATTQLHSGYVGSEKVVVAELSLRGRLEEIPEPLFFWRLHPEHVGRGKAIEATKKMDPRWSGRFTFMGLRQVAGYARAIRRAPLSRWEKTKCRFILIEKVIRGVARALAPRGS